LRAIVVSSDAKSSFAQSIASCQRAHL
jgi:hypothetical protein